ncbi:MAG: tRNA (uridine(54)-C5)-methyltransferase TrmA, partial [Halieaceae bacterium]|nr:tRNA (uridine(54)-C5)-methyltransferase TrmA [Halieaceae bacterium]
MPLSAVDPARYPELLAAKCDRVIALLAPFSPPAPQVFPSTAEGFRMRAEFRLWHDGDALEYVMFRRDDPATPVPVKHFPIACERIRQL